MKSVIESTGRVFISYDYLEFLFTLRTNICYISCTIQQQITVLGPPIVKLFQLLHQLLFIQKPEDFASLKRMAEVEIEAPLPNTKLK